MNQAFALSSWFPFVTVAVLIATLLLLQRFFRRNRADSLAGVAVQLGLKYEGHGWHNGSRAPHLETPFFEGKSGEEFDNIISGARDGLACSLFDYSFSSGGSSIRQTLATFTQEL